MDLGCNYEEVIRVNSQSGKSGAAWLLQENHGLSLPKMLQVDLSQRVKRHTDQTGREISIAELWQLFRQAYGLTPSPEMRLLSYQSQPAAAGQQIESRVRFNQEEMVCSGIGNGLLSAMLNALTEQFGITCNIVDYHEHTLGSNTRSKAVSYVQLQSATSNVTQFGVAIDEDATKASLQAVMNAYANMLKTQPHSRSVD
ncbi:alpha-isopropylmalate synthase regulatory domain-containing protein [Vibrio furnissii]